MPNPLTGDFQLVAEVSGRTINRLLASIHQNAITAPTLPRTLARTTMRLGDAGFGLVIDGVRGAVWAQIGVPSVELIHRATDEVWVRASVRAHFQADPGSAPFPEFINGRVRAKYRMAPTPIFVLGKVLLSYLRLIVDPASVSFRSFGDPSADLQITKQIRAVMTRRMPLTPHPLLDDFIAGRFRSLVGAGETAVCHPLGAGATADIESVDQVFLGGRDFAVAVSREYVLSQLQATLDSLQSKALPQFEVLWGTYTATVQSASATWAALTLPAGSWVGYHAVGAVTLHVSGEATTSSVLPNVGFSVVHELWILFDPVSESLSVVSGKDPSVSVNPHGLVGKLIRKLFRRRITDRVTDKYNAALAPVLVQAGPKLQAALGQKQKLVQQLKTLDAQGDAHFDEAESTPDGFVLRGVIGLTPRASLVVKASKLTDDTGYTAFESWIPGGEIRSFHWRWYFTTAPIPAGAPPDGAETHEDRFLLRSSAPVPGIPIYSPTGGPRKVIAGRVCLMLSGRVVNAVTGGEDAVDNLAETGRERNCVYVVPTPPLPPSASRAFLPPRLWWTLWLAKATGESAAAEPAVAAHVEVRGSPGQRFNTLVHYVCDSGGDAVSALRALGDGVRAGAVPGAGLLVVVVLAEELRGRAAPALQTALAEVARDSDAPVMVTEDVHGGWAAALGLDSTKRRQSASRLVGPDGTVMWAHEGSADGSTIAAALREHLQPAAAPRPEPVELDLAPGDEAPAARFAASVGGWLELRALGARPITLTFVQPWSRPCIAQLRRLQRLQQTAATARAVTVALVEGVPLSEAQALAQQHGLTYVVGADPDGTIARRFGVRVWPTTVTLDANGRVAEIDLGADAGALAALARES